MSKILLITPPFIQPNTPYPATAYLKGYLARNGVEVEQYDLSIELMTKILSASFLKQVFADRYLGDDDSFQRMYALRERYITVVGSVVKFLQGGDLQLANLISMPDFIPQAYRFESMVDIEEMYGSMGTIDCAKYICTLFLQDLSDYIREVVTPHFEIGRYAEKIAISIPSFKDFEAELEQPLNIIETEMLALLQEQLDTHKPQFVTFTVPFPGNFLSTLRCAQYIKSTYPDIQIVIGGGYPSTELRQMSDKGIFKYVDYVVLDDGELSLKRIIDGGELIRTYTAKGYVDNFEKISHLDRGCPDFSSLPFEKYFSLCEVTNPMHRLWGDGRWNKIMLAHGCYWAKCAFCDTSLDYIKCYDAVSAVQIVDWMESIAKQTGSTGFHFVDEAAPPKLLKEMSLELLRRGLKFSWWTNIRFEASYTGDLCYLMAAAGCIAVSGGLEVAADRLLKMIDKGVTIEQAVITMRNLYYSGIMVHTYLMYGLPTQTLQESVDSLEVVRQMFQAELIASAFWHRYAMTIHSPSGLNPEKYGVTRKNSHVNCFANNEVHFVENRGYNVNAVGEGLRLSLAHYMVGEGLDRAPHKWIEGKSPKTTVEPTVITDALIKPDNCRIFNSSARIVWIGADFNVVDGELVLYTASSTKSMKFADEDREFLVKLLPLCSDLNRNMTFAEIKELYEEFSKEPFSTLYHSKKWDIMRSYGLLQI